MIDVKYKDAIKYRYAIMKQTSYKKDGETKYARKFYAYHEHKFNRMVRDMCNSECESFYQVINNEEIDIAIKPYFDIDKCELTEDGLNNLISDLCKCMYEMCSCSLCRDDFIVEHTSTYPYNSIHLTIHNVNVKNKSVLKDICDYFNRDKITQLDNKVYTRNRQYKLNNNYKLNEGESNRMIDHSGNKYFTMKDRWMTIITDTNPIKITNKDIIKLLMGEKRKSLTHLITSSNHTIKDDTSVNIEEISVVDGDLIQRLLLTNLDKEFYTSPKWTLTTKFLLRELLSENKEQADLVINDWLRVSAEMTDDDKHTFTSNKKWIETCDISIVNNYTLSTLCKLVNPYLQTIHLSVEKIKFTSEMVDYIKDITNLTENSILDTWKSYIEQDECSRTDILQLDMNTLFNLKQATLVYNCEFYNFNEKAYEKELDNMEYNINYDVNIKPDKPTNTTFIETHLEPHINDFISTVVKTLIMKARWGAGKSHRCMYPIIQRLVQQNKDVCILIITENNNLNNEYLRKYESCGFCSHQSTNVSCSMSNRIICSVESLIKLPHNKFDLVVLDEYESIISQFENESTINKVKNPHSASNLTTIHDAFINFSTLCRNATRCLILDADISKLRIDLMKSIRPPTTTEGKNDYRSILLDVNNFNETEINHFIKIDDFRETFKQSVSNGEKVILCATSKRDISIYYKYLQSLNKELSSNGGFADGDIRNLRVLSYDSSGAHLHIGQMVNNVWTSPKELGKDGLEKSPKDIKLDIQKVGLEKYIMDMNISVFLYSPSVTTGLSIDTEYFSSEFCIGDVGSVNSRGFLQMMFRARHLKTINLFVGSNYKYRPSISLDTMGQMWKNLNYITDKKQYISGDFGVSKNDMALFDELCVKDIDIDSDSKTKTKAIELSHLYFRMRMINATENMNSTNRFTQEIITKIKYNHTLTHKYIYNLSCKDVSQQLTKCSNELKQEIIDRYISLPLLRTSEYHNIKHKIEESKSNSSATTEEEMPTDYEYECYNKYQFLFDNIDSTCKYGGYIFQYLIDIEDVLSIDIKKQNERHNSRDSEGKLKEDSWWSFFMRNPSYNLHSTNYRTDDMIIELNKYNYNDRTDSLIDISKYLYNKEIVSINEYFGETSSQKKRYIRLEEDTLYDKYRNEYLLFNTQYEIEKSNLENIYYQEYLYKYEKAMNLYNVINCDIFYKTWLKRETVDKYKLFNQIYRKYNQQEQILSDTDYIHKSQIKVYKKMRTTIDTWYIIHLLKCIGITDIRDKKQFTNESFMNQLKSVADKLIKLETDYKTRCLLGGSSSKAITSEKLQDATSDNWKSAKQDFMKHMNQQFTKLNMILKYDGDNTNRKTSKLDITFKDIIYPKTNAIKDIDTLVFNSSTTKWKDSIGQITYLLNNDYENLILSKTIKKSRSRDKYYKFKDCKVITNLHTINGKTLIHRRISKWNRTKKMNDLCKSIMKPRKQIDMIDSPWDVIASHIENDKLIKKLRIDIHRHFIQRFAPCVF